MSCILNTARTVSGAPFAHYRGLSEGPAEPSGPNKRTVPCVHWKRGRPAKNGVGVGAERERRAATIVLRQVLSRKGTRAIWMPLEKAVKSGRLDVGA
jgi:hypothetical protein